MIYILAQIIEKKIKGDFSNNGNKLTALLPVQFLLFVEAISENFTIILNTEIRTEFYILHGTEGTIS